MKKVALVLFAGIWMCGIALAQEPPLPKEAKALVDRASALKSYQAKFTLQAKEENGEEVRLEGTVVFEKPNRRRLSLKNSGEKEASQMIVSDGTTEWQYDVASKTVYKIKATADIPGPHRPFGEVKPETLRFVRSIGEGVAAISRFEAVPLPAVVEGSPVAIESLRVDVGQKDGLVRELVLLDPKGETVFTQRYEEIQVNLPIAQGTFIFTPPAEVRVVEPGQPAPAGPEKP